jgi:DNA-binding phage protein
MLYDALTHMPIRRETDAERRAAAAAREVGDVDGWIVVDGRLCYVRQAVQRRAAAPAGQTLRASIIAEMRRRQYGVGELARKAGVSRPWLSRWLTKPGRLAREDTLDRLRKALGLSDGANS